jgi:hypothetical protein
MDAGKASRLFLLSFKTLFQHSFLHGDIPLVTVRERPEFTRTGDLQEY